LQASEQQLKANYTLQDYFKQCKWVMVLDPQLYEEYLQNELKPALRADLSLI